MELRTSPGGQDLGLPGGTGGERAVLAQDELVAGDDDLLHPPLAAQLDRRAQEPQADRLRLARLRRSRRQLAQELDVALGRRGRAVSEERGRVLVELEVGGVDVHVGLLQLAELAQLGRGEGGLHGAAAAEQRHVADRRVAQRLERVVGDVRDPQLLVGQAEHPGHVDGDVAVADDHGLVDPEVERMVAVVGVAVVPADEAGGRPDAGQVGAGDPEGAVRLGADGVDHGVVALHELVAVHVPADLDVAEPAQARVGRRLVVDPRDGLDLRVVGRHAGADEPPRRGQALVEVDLHLGVVLGQEVPGGVEAGGARADDGHPQRASHAPHPRRSIARGRVRPRALASPYGRMRNCALRAFDERPEASCAFT
jgi:hypothetical protein